jgi:RND family efflux transporter MFP subunit
LTVPSTTAPMRGLRWIAFVALLVAVLLAAIGLFLRHAHLQTVRNWTDAQAIATVNIVRPKREQQSSNLALPGNIQAWFEAPIYSRVSGYIKNWSYDYGAKVKKGAVLATIIAPDLDARFAAAEARLKAAQADVMVQQAKYDYAKSTFERWASAPTGVVSVQEREDRRGQYGSAHANLQASIANVSAAQGEVNRLGALEGYKEVTAPFDGYVTARETDVGALINAGSGIGGGSGPELFRVADIHEMRIYVQVPQALSAGIHPGMAAELHLPQYPDRMFSATVATTAREVNLSSRTLLVELRAPNPNGVLQPGSYAEVSFQEVPDSRALTIPTNALLFREHGLEVAVVDQHNKVALRHVTAGRNFGTEIEIVKGLDPSDRVIAGPPDSIAAGDLVQIRQQADATSFQNDYAIRRWHGGNLDRTPTSLGRQADDLRG